MLEVGAGCGSFTRDYINEEILYREALKLGLDKDDRIIKRRLGQKISFLKQETQFKNPTTEDLINFYEKNICWFFSF